MRESTLLLTLIIAACGDASDPPGVVIEDFRERSGALACERVALEDGLAVTALRATSDSTWAVLDEPQRLVRGYDDRMRLLWTVRLAAEGPRALPMPDGFAVVGDSLVYVVDRSRFALGALDVSDGEGRLLRLDFVPGGVAALPDGGAVVTALPIGRRPPALLFRVEGDSLTPVDVPQRPYPDLSVNGLGNMVLAEAGADGSILLIHQFLAPRAFRVAADGRVRALNPPVPDGTAAKREYVPVPPLTEESLPSIYVGAAALSVDRGTGEVYVLTQTGRREGDRSERAVMRLDPDLAYLGSYLLDLDLNVGHMAVLARRRALLLADDLDRVHLCPVPDDAAGVAGP